MPFYIQVVEVVHEKYHTVIREAAEKYKNDQLVKGPLFHYLHFYGTYDYAGDSRKWYNKGIRITRNDKVNFFLPGCPKVQKAGTKVKGETH